MDETPLGRGPVDLVPSDHTNDVFDQLLRFEVEVCLTFQANLIQGDHPCFRYVI